MLNLELSKRCIVNYQCSNHFHIGGVNFTKETIVLMYYLYCKLQSELYLMVPLSRRTNEYCRPLNDLSIDIDKLLFSNPDRLYYIEYYYNNIIAFISKTGSSGIKNNKKEDHPKGFKCNYDHSTARYCWVNFTPAVFDTREMCHDTETKNGRVNNIDPNNYTIEFRLASGGTSYIKNKNWLLIFIGLVDFVENHKRELFDNIHTIDLDTIMRICYPSNYPQLIEFIRSRKELFSEKDSLKNALIEEKDYLDNELDENYSLRSL